MTSSETAPQRPKESWRGVAIEERLAFITEALFVMFPVLVEILKEIRRRYKRAVAQKKSTALLIICPTRGGKSTLRRLLARIFPSDRTSEGLVLPYVGFDIPAAPSPATMPKELLRNMGDAAWNMGNALTSMDRVTGLLQRAQTKIIAIDNVQDVPERRGKKGVLLVGNWIRDLWDQAGCLILLFGTNEAQEVVDANPQLRGRVSARMYVEYFEFTTKSGQAIFREFLKKLDAALPIAEMCDLSQWAEQIHMGTNGIQGHIFGLIAEAIPICTENGRETLTLEDLARAFDLYFQGAVGKVNPFRTTVPFRALDREGEPFHNWNSGHLVVPAKNAESKPSNSPTP